MPRGDGTGPAGMGPMTGRAAGYCAGYNAPGFANPVPGPGFDRGMGFGRGFGRGRGLGFGRGFGRGAGFGRAVAIPAPAFVPAPAPAYGYQGYQPAVQPRYTKEDEIADLRTEKEFAERDIKAIQEQLKAIDVRLKELETKKS